MSKISDCIHACCVRRDQGGDFTNTVLSAGTTGQSQGFMKYKPDDLERRQ